MKKVNKTVWLDSNGTEHATKGGMLYAERSARIFEYLLQQGFPKEHCWHVADIVADLKHWPRLQELMSLDLVEDTDKITAPDYDSAMDDASWGNKPDNTVARAKDWPSMEGTPQERLQARRERVAEQDRQPHTGLCKCPVGVRGSVVAGTGCVHCVSCGGVIVGQADADYEKDNDANEFKRMPRRNRFPCDECGQRYEHRVDCSKREDK
jgi:hypothetical protein